MAPWLSKQPVALIKLLSLPSVPPRSAAAPRRQFYNRNSACAWWSSHFSWIRLSSRCSCNQDVCPRTVPAGIWDRCAGATTRNPDHGKISFLSFFRPTAAWKCCKPCRTPTIGSRYEGRGLSLETMSANAEVTLNIVFHFECKRTHTTMICIILRAMLGDMCHACCIVRSPRSKMQIPPRIWARSSIIANSRMIMVAWNSSVTVNSLGSHFPKIKNEHSLVCDTTKMFSC